MAKKQTGELVIKHTSDKDTKLTINLAEKDARKLRAFCAFIGRDLGDVVTHAIRPVMAGFTVRHRDDEADPADNETPRSAEGSGSGSRVTIHVGEGQDRHAG